MGNTFLILVVFSTRIDRQQQPPPEQKWLFLDHSFLNYLIARCGEAVMIRSPDMSTCEFFLWRYLKELVNKNQLRIFIDLKEVIRQQMIEVNRDRLERVKTNLLQHLQQCVNRNCHQMRDLIFRTWKDFLRISSTTKSTNFRMIPNSLDSPASPCIKG